MAAVSLRSPIWILVLQCVACGDSLGTGAGVNDQVDVDAEAAQTHVDYPLCDGSSAMRLAVRAYVSAGSLEFGQQVQFDNGAWFLFVDGHCTYYALPSARWTPVVTGVLSSREAKALSSELELGLWEGRSGPYQGEAIDGAAIIMEDGSLAVECTAGCAGGEVPESVQAMVVASRRWAMTLWEQGTTQSD